MLNDRIKCGVDTDLPILMRLHPLPQGAVEAEIHDLQDHSRVRAPPQHGLTFAKPRKAAFAVSFSKTLHSQTTACS